MRCIVLLGIGHTNADVVHRWAESPLRNCRLVCISKFPYSTYSGMLTGTLAEQFQRREMRIELGPLVKQAGAELILDEVVRHDPKTRTLEFAQRDPITFDAMSVGVGSMPMGWSDVASPSLVPIKPMQTFLERLDNRLETLCKHSQQPNGCLIVGGGVAGVEVALCLQARLDHHQLNSTPISIVTAGTEIADGLKQGTKRKLRRLLETRSIRIVDGFRAVEVQDDCVRSQDGQIVSAGLVIWATGAAPPPVIDRLNLPTCERGFLATDRTLRSVSGQPIFAVGDCGTIHSDPVPKAGVYAVREAPILWHNLQALLEDRPLKEYRPQQDFLKILNTGDGKGLLEYGRFHFHAGWCRRLKDWIDKRFVRQYQS